MTINPIRHYSPDCIGERQRIWTEEIFNVPKRYVRSFRGVAAEVLSGFAGAKSSF